MSVLFLSILETELDRPPQQKVLDLPYDGKLSLLLGFASLALLRYQFVREAQLSATEALAAGLWVGWLFDLVVLMIVEALASLAGAAGTVPRRVVWSALALLAWSASVANVLYFRFFGGVLAWWIVVTHWSDVPEVATGAYSLALTPLILASAASLTVALVVLWRGPRSTARRRAWLVRGVALLVLALGLREVPLRLGHLRVGDTRMELKEHVAQLWLRDVLRPASGDRWSWTDAAIEAGAAGDEASSGPGLDRHYASAVEEFRSLRSTLPAAMDLFEDVDGAASDEMSTTSQLRRRLGLPAEGPLRVVLLFIEGARSFELQHPTIGPATMPRLRSLLDRYGVFFSQAYTSSLSAGETVRGQFSTLCSVLPNMGGVATFIGYSDLDVQCLADSLADERYRTLWFNSHDKTHHNKNVFERLHGTQEFFDREFFLSRGVTEKIGDWGLGDRSVLREVASALSTAPEPALFANVLTVSTHYPYSMVNGVELPDWLVRDTEGHPEYRAYLSRLRYADGAIGGFFDRLFAAQDAERTLVVLLGDHSARVSPHLELSASAALDMTFRVPLALVTRDLPQPAVLHHPVHQIDVAPTVARIVGIDPDEAWWGADLTSQAGSPWVFEDGSRLHYRAGSVACYTLAGDRTLECFDLAPGEDPMLDMSLTEASEDPAVSTLMRRVVRAARHAIRHDRVQSVGANLGRQASSER